MKVYFTYPLATPENLAAVKNAINSGMKAYDLEENFSSEVVWDCVVVLSGNHNTPWSLFSIMEGNEQCCTDDWQDEFIEQYVNAVQFSQEIKNEKP